MMKKRSLFVLLSILLPLSLFADTFFAGLTEDQYKRYTADRPMLIYLSLDCSIGSGLNREFRESFSDFKGVYLASADINTHYHFIKTMKKRTLGTMFLAYRGEVLASSEEALIKPYRFNEYRRWAVKVMREHNLSFRHTEWDDGLFPSDAARENAAQGLDTGKVYDFDFQRGSFDKNPVTPGDKSRIGGGAFSINGVDRSRIFLHDLLTHKPFTLALTFKRTRPPGYLNDGVIFQTMNRDFRILVFKNRLMVNLAVYRMKGGKPFGYDEMYQFTDINLEEGKSYNLVVSFLPGKRVVRILLNGKRLKDVRPSSRLINFLRANPAPGFFRGIHFYSAGAKGGFDGLLHRLVFYKRGLTTQEMKSLYAGMKPGVNAGTTVPSGHDGTVDFIANGRKQGMAAFVDFDTGAEDRMRRAEVRIGKKSSVRNGRLVIGGSDITYIGVRDLDPGKAFSIAFSFKRDTEEQNTLNYILRTARTGIHLFTGRNGVLTLYYSVYDKNGKLHFKYHSLGRKLENGRWYHLVLVFNPQAGSIFVVLDGRGIGIINLEADVHSAYRNRQYSVKREMFHFRNGRMSLVGSVDNVVIFDRALDGVTVNEVYRKYAVK